MRANDLLEKAVLLLGYEAHGYGDKNDKSLSSRILCAINTILSDLSLGQISSIFDEITPDDSTEAAAVYGVAMMLSVLEGDAARNEFFSRLYNQKRASAKFSLGKISDVLPKSEAM